MNALRSKALTVAVVLGSALAVLAAPTSAFTDIVANTGTFSGQVKSNNANVLTSAVEHWTALAYIDTVSVITARTVGRYKTGSAATLTDLFLQSPYNIAGRTTAQPNLVPLNFTDTSGTVLCSVTYDCHTVAGTLYSNQTSCGSVALAANTEYQIRIGQCGTGNSNSYISVTARMTIP